MSLETALREEICRIGQSLYARGYTVGSAGNISARLDDGYLITPTDACLGFLDPARISKVDLKGEQISGDRASKAVRLHRAIYETDASLNGVVHTHSTHLVAMSILAGVSSHTILDAITPYHVMKAGRIPLIPYHRPGDPAVIDLVKPLVRDVRGVMLSRIGPTFWHENISNAAFAIEEAEETAKLFFMTRGHALPPLSETQVDELRTLFPIKW
jgi:ribulose-5-phosphate 4-epimerase/fuculose-1-phosphate aldolase